MPRRSVYIPVVRSSMYEMFQAFDLPDPSTPNGDRNSTVVAPQALFMMNATLVLKSTRNMAEKLLDRSDRRRRAHPRGVRKGAGEAAGGERSRPRADLHRAGGEGDGGQGKGSGGPPPVRVAELLQGAALVERIHLCELRKYEPSLELLSEPDAFAARTSARQQRGLWVPRAGRVAGRTATAGAAAGGANPLAVKAPHFPARAKRVIFLFMHGGPSQVDTFDYKPLLMRDHGKPLPFARPKVVSSETFNLLKSPWEFKQYGQSGTWVSDLFPRIAKRVDDICFIKSMWGSNSRHGGALLEMHTGSDTFVRPSMGSWITYGLGSENQNMPGYHHHLPDAEPRRREQLQLRPSCRRRTRARRSARWGSSATDARIPYIANTETPRTSSAWNSILLRR